MLRKVRDQDAKDQEASESNGEGIWRGEGSAVPVGRDGGGGHLSRVDEPKDINVWAAHEV